VRLWDGDGWALYFNELRKETDGNEIPFWGESGLKDRLTQVISSGEYLLRRRGDHLTYRFSSEGRLIEIFHFNGNRISLGYEGGRLSQVTNNFGKGLAFQYNSDGLIQSVIDLKGQGVSYGYLGRDLIRVSSPDGLSAGHGYSDHRLTDKYDSHGNLASVILPEGNRIDLAYDLANRLTGDQRQSWKHPWLRIRQRGQQDSRREEGPIRNPKEIS
jgi:YD repeat-containing protein